jgi:hypothetical protein
MFNEQLADPVLINPNFGQKTKGFKTGSWVQIKQQYLIILCFFFPLVWGLSSEYLKSFFRGFSEGILCWTFICWPPFLLPLFSISPFWSIVLYLSGT